MLKLFYAVETCALASHIALIEAGADYETAEIDFARSEQGKPEFLAVNPKGRVPALVTDNGILTETPAILVYIAQTFPTARLAPLDDPFALAKVQEFNSYICATLHVAHAHRMRGSRWSDEDAAIAAMQTYVPQAIGGCYALIEQEMFEGPWVMGEAHTICDPYLFTLAQWMEADGVDPSGFPNVADHRRRIGERASVKRALKEQFGG